MLRLLIITNEVSDLSKLMETVFDCQYALLHDAIDFDTFDAFALLGGTQEYPPSILPPVRTALERQMAMGKPVFSEFTLGAGESCFSEPVPSLKDRPVCVGECNGLQLGEILDEQANNRLPVQYLPPEARLVLQYVPHPDGLYVTSPLPEVQRNHVALFYETPHLLQCAFRLCYVFAARFGPRAAWRAVLMEIVRFLGASISAHVIDARMNHVYSFSGVQTHQQCLARACAWFENAGMLVFYGGEPRAVLEGVTAVISPMGAQKKAYQHRLDSIGETALMYYLKGRNEKDARALAYSNALFATVREMQIMGGIHKGAVRGSLGWWGNASYHDDTARGFLLPLTVRALLSRDKGDTAQIDLALEYLLKSTGKDGLRVNQVNRIDNKTDSVRAARMVKNGSKWRNSGFYDTTLEDLRSTSAESPSAHYNAFYMAALLLGYHLTQKEAYLHAGVHGLTALMHFYPDTAREHSQTQEMIRLLMPLAVLYMTTKDELHKKWLYQVLDDLQQCSPIPGAYIEHDEGYTASCSRSATGECSVFSHNGDPICDFLYSMNWLPSGLFAAWRATGDEVLGRRYREALDFVASVQLRSPDKLLDGAWARGIDIERREVYGVNNDREWSVWTLEAGWTVAELAIGFLLEGLVHGVFTPIPPFGNPI